MAESTGKAFDFKLFTFLVALAFILYAPATIWYFDEELEVVSLVVKSLTSVSSSAFIIFKLIAGSGLAISKVAS